MRILCVTTQVPYPLTSGAPLRSYNILRRLAADNEVYLIAFASTEGQRKGLAHLHEFCRMVVTVEPQHLGRLMGLQAAGAAMLRGQPPELGAAFSKELAREISRLTERVEFDVVQIEHGSMGMYVNVLSRQLRKRAVWVLHDIDFDKFRRIARIERRKDKMFRAWLHAKMMRRWQPQFAGLFGLCITMSDFDRELLLAANKSLSVQVSPNGVDTKRYHPLPEEMCSSNILFVGHMGYQPNVDAALYFSHEVLPLIRRRVAGCTLWIVGNSPAASVRHLAGNGVFVTGSVPDVVPYYKRSTVCVVPLRAGSGTRLKILEAMALGRPVVTTAAGCEGLNVIAGEHLLMADDSEGFAEHTVALLMNHDLRTKIAAKARDLVSVSYDWDVITTRLMSAFEELVSQNRQRQHDRGTNRSLMLT
jgi:polysaccharide biosynthesis protein PslH